MHRLLRGSALAVDGDAGDMFGQASDQPGGAADVPGLGPDGVAAAPDDIVDGAGIDSGAGDERAQRVRGEIGGVNRGETALLAADGGADSVDDIGFSHGVSFATLSPLPLTRRRRLRLRERSRDARSAAWERGVCAAVGSTPLPARLRRVRPLPQGARCRRGVNAHPKLCRGPMAMPPPMTAASKRAR